MKATKLLHKSLLTACPDMHKIRLKALIAGVTSGLTEHQVTVTGLGRNLKSHSKTTTKHDIKRMDRLRGNHYLHAECRAIYQYLSTQSTGQQNILILSDAIFKTPWFKSIEARSWYWVGRVRDNVQLSLNGKTFKGCTRIMKRATTTPRKLGTVLYSKST